MVMGPTCGMMLADMGAEVIKVEPIDGDRTRRLLGAGAGFFPMFNRNKKSIAIDLHHADGAEVARRLAASADVVIENFKPGHDGQVRPRLRGAVAGRIRALIYVSHKGFLPGPVRASHGARRSRADDGRPRVHDRAGPAIRCAPAPASTTSWAACSARSATLGALIQRGVTGRGMEVQSALFENNVFLMGQHMLQFAMTGTASGADARARQSVGDLRRVHGRRTASRSSSPPSATRSG